MFTPSPNRAANGDRSVWLSSSIGSVRTQNQDRVAHLVMRDKETPARDFRVAVLSDGMGGMAQGDVAATITVSAFLTRLLRTTRLSPRERLEGAANYANEAVFSALNLTGGATLSAVLIDRSGKHFGVNVGDSRIYGISRSKELFQVSTDDTIAGYLGAGANGGRVSGELVQFIGMEQGSLEPHVIELQSGRFDYALLTTDGLHGTDIETMKKITSRCQALDRELLSKLTSLSNLLGGRDNASGVVLNLNQDFGTEPIEGREVTVFSVSENLNIWITKSGGERSDREQLGAASERPRKVEEEGHAPVPKAPAGQSRQSKPARKSKRSKKGVPPQDASLPLEPPTKPILNVEFPPRDNDK
ncbi:PP2C family protein-serine/threonine phosphatase [Mesorhizobium sp. ES1-3]|uniref:PP2C family protein-serine/threonine phosphatase n=1 Tax=Mesorhizobium sp. ES1-3 TaxID=2876628 RepID=UPI001CCD34B1|nr:protein phosphatase 2C domain-containing protein [Mesorhizobium sp. ES1-3]MBZ9673955.1 protein phosphatase 2C domain-containing protein [Mesorhizobium sp. ES1-3]